MTDDALLARLAALEAEVVRLRSEAEVRPDGTAPGLPEASGTVGRS